MIAALANVRASWAADSSFELTATEANPESYFPTYLANGYFSTMTAPRGTEANAAYLVAFMDRAPQDVARPAAIPGWTGIDYSSGSSSAGEFWLNQTRISPQSLSEYRQTLNLYDATLTTSYRFTDATRRETRIRVRTFVSQASPHLGVTELSFTPEFSGRVRLAFSLQPWAPHQPRFAMAQLTSAQLTATLEANGMNLIQPVSATTPDRAPIWYHGDTHVLQERGDAKALTLWLDGRAEGGLAMAEAAAIALPAALKPENIQLATEINRLSLSVSLEVQRGRTYTVSKYVAISREDWGGDSQQMRTAAGAARARGFEALLNEHRAAWHNLWTSDIRIAGDPAAQRAVHSDLYYLLSSTTASTAWPVAACALTPNYAGHTFWDSDSWVFPALLLLHPERARALVMFRYRTLAPARALAAQHGVRGAMYPWEADPDNGSEQTPHFAQAAVREIHVNADIAIAQWQYFLATGDRAWLQQFGWPVIRAIAEFWASRVKFNQTAQRYEIHHVMSPDEAYDDVSNDAFTNASASKALVIATEAAREIGVAPDPLWAQIATRMYIPFSATEQRHLDFDPSVPHDKVTWMGSSLSRLAYPNLDLSMPAEVRRNDFAYQLHELAVHGNDPNEMMMVMLAVHAAELGEGNVAGRWIDRNLIGFLKPPFQVRSETATNNAGYILATSAGFLQSLLFGFTGLRLDRDGLAARFAPVLPDAWTSIELTNISLRGAHYDLTIDRGAAGKVRLRRVLRSRGPR